MSTENIYQETYSKKIETEVIESFSSQLAHCETLPQLLTVLESLKASVPSFLDQYDTNLNNKSDIENQIVLKIDTLEEGLKEIGLKIIFDRYDPKSYTFLTSALQPFNKNSLSVIVFNIFQQYATKVSSCYEDKLSFALENPSLENWKKVIEDSLTSLKDMKASSDDSEFKRIVDYSIDDFTSWLEALNKIIKGVNNDIDDTFKKYGIFSEVLPNKIASSIYTLIRNKIPAETNEDGNNVPDGVISAPATGVLGEVPRHDDTLPIQNLNDDTYKTPDGQGATESITGGNAITTPVPPKLYINQISKLPPSETLKYFLKKVRYSKLFLRVEDFFVKSGFIKEDNRR